MKNSDIETIDYIDACQSNGYLFLNSLHPDHFTTSGDSIKTYIDHIFTNQTNSEYYFTLVDNQISDHRVLVLSQKTDTCISLNKKTNSTYQTIDYEEIDNNLNELISIANASNFTIFIMNFIKKHTKTLTKKSKNRKDWANNELIELTKIRDKLYK